MLCSLRWAWKRLTEETGMEALASAGDLQYWGPLLPLSFPVNLGEQASPVHTSAVRLQSKDYNGELVFEPVLRGSGALAASFMPVRMGCLETQSASSVQATVHFCSNAPCLGLACLSGTCGCFVCTRVCNWCLGRPEEGIRFSGTGVTWLAVRAHVCWESD